MEMTNAEPVANIVGELVTLGPLRRDLVPTYQRWMNDLAVVRNIGAMPLPMTLEREESWFERAAKSDDSFSFTIYGRASGTSIGNTSLMGLDWRSRTAEFGILIGEAAGRGKGYGTETARLMLDYAFVALGLHSVYLRVHEYNLAGRRAYEKAGFREFGRRRQSQQMGGKFWDTIYMDCLSSEFTSPVLAAIFAPDTPR
ncbi:MAG TPA: GNAT family N-acetyltransferase [Thermomicrobiales bacterium]|jgi:RimJ/RimL family protein N-acetyltransferase